MDALNARWEAKSGVAQLADFELSFRLGPGAILDPKTVDCVSKLNDKGMRIHVGPRTVR